MGTELKQTLSEEVLATSSDIADVAHLSGTETFTGAKRFSNTVMVGDGSSDNILITDSTIQKMTSGHIETYSFPASGGTLALQDECNRTNITYADLVSARDNNKLIPGMEYRITDYETKVYDFTGYSLFRSKGHQFDIIVVADSTNKLNERARAALHSGDTYFSNSKLEKWELKYCLDNDSSVYAWADETSGKGVIYWMKDEFDNECPYDFKNVQVKRYSTNNSIVEDGQTRPSIFSSNKPYVKYGFFPAIRGCSSFYTVEGSDLKSWGYSSANENYNYYGILAYRMTIYVCVDETTARWFYTFDSGNEVDLSLSKENYVFSNIIKKSGYGDLFLPGNIFLGSCNRNTVGYESQTNTFGESCRTNTFGDSYCANTLGDYCDGNAFGDACDTNAFGDTCRANTFGNFCYGNTFGNFCHDNTFGNNCYFNTFGNSCYFNTFGNGCNYNIFGDSNAGKDNYTRIIFENGVNHITLNRTSNTGYYQNVKLAQGLANKTINDANHDQTTQTVYQPANSQVISI